MKKKQPKWLDEPQSHDYPAAEEYLSLLYEDTKAHKLAKLLAKKELIRFHAKDIFRASELPHLGKENFHVNHNIQKIKNDEFLSPILLVKDTKLVIADGYHRMCAVYLYDEDARIPCKLADVNNI